MEALFTGPAQGNYILEVCTVPHTFEGFESQMSHTDNNQG